MDVYHQIPHIHPKESETHVQNAEVFYYIIDLK